MSYVEVLLDEKEKVRLSKGSEYEIPYLSFKEFFEFLGIKEQIKAIKELNDAIIQAPAKQRKKLVARIERYRLVIVGFLSKIHGKPKGGLLARIKWRRDLSYFCRPILNLTRLIERIHFNSTQAMADCFFLHKMEALQPLQTATGRWMPSSDRQATLDKYYREKYKKKNG